MLELPLLLEHDRNLCGEFIDPIVQVDISTLETDVSRFEIIPLPFVFRASRFGRLQLSQESAIHRFGTALFRRRTSELGTELGDLVAAGLCLAFQLIDPIQMVGDALFGGRQ